MLRMLRSCALISLLLTTSAASASFHLFRIEQIYSNADGTIQFIVLHESFGMNGEDAWSGQTLTSSGGRTVSRPSPQTTRMSAATLSERSSTNRAS